ncbi:30S ribosomal protein S9 [Candidatus Parcubacteria bacterium A4]|nr:MAG: 30S ribosomal protein S9 [Candidatus Parcubacteria bacterium A4]
MVKRQGYFTGTGRRKTSIARVRLSTQGDKEILINDMPLEKYFVDPNLQQIVNSPLGIMKCLGKFRITVVLRGGGVHSQAEAVRHGISRALVLFNLEFKKRLRKAEYLTRDQRMRERKKFGLKRARRAPQWAKR